jgi:hypothetical protein
VLSDAEKVYIKNLLKDAVKNYNLYLSKTQNAEDTDEVKKHIASLEEKIDPVEDNTAETETQPQTAEAE